MTKSRAKPIAASEPDTKFCTTDWLGLQVTGKIFDNEDVTTGARCSHSDFRLTCFAGSPCCKLLRIAAAAIGAHKVHPPHVNVFAMSRISQESPDRRSTD